jgi:formylglycine-generating enzyme required for sulfatase activity
MTQLGKDRKAMVRVFLSLLMMTLGTGGVHAQVPILKPSPSLARKLAGEFVKVPAGRFRMGDVAGKAAAFPSQTSSALSELPVHTVGIKAFKVGKTEVTRGQFATFVQETNYLTDAERNAGGNQGCKILDASDNRPIYRPGRNWRDPLYAQKDDHPAVCLSWNDAQAFIEWLNKKTNGHFRLLSEAEWEYAARAGSEDEFPWGPDVNQSCSYANVADLTPWPNGIDWKQQDVILKRASRMIDCNDGYFKPSPVATYKPNKFGLFDMIGNVWEWVQDCSNATYEGAPSDGSAWTTGDCSERLFLGGSYDNGREQLRVSVRFKSDPTLRDVALGFRLAED